MGRKSKLPQVLRQTKQARRHKVYSRMQSPWACPRCSKFTVYYKKDKDCIFIYCVEEGQGEVMPLHPTYSLIDYYCVWADLKYHECFDEPWIEPVWRFRRMHADKLQDLRKRVTLGRIEVVDVRE